VSVPEEVPRARVGELERLVGRRGPLIRRGAREGLVEHAAAEAALDRFVPDLLGAERASLHGVPSIVRPGEDLEIEVA
jgi:hypothetical protein